MQDQHEPDGKWKFDESVTNVFDNMLERSIPQYDVMRKACFEVGKPFVKPQTHIVDVGCSRGMALAPFVKEFGHRNAYLGIEASESMVKAAREMFKDESTVHISHCDVRGWPLSDMSKVSLFLSVLTIQFTPIEYRQGIIQNVYDSLLPGGAFVFVEKVLGNTSRIDELMVEVYYNKKRDNGYSQDQIERKRLSLEGVLVPITASWNEQLLQSAGFTSIDCFWRWMNFAGWVAIK